VILIDGLDESLDSGLFNEFLLVNFSLNPLGIPGDASYDDMWEFVFLDYGDGLLCFLTRGF
jgi:hypothetical protein